VSSDENLLDLFQKFILCTSCCHKRTMLPSDGGDHTGDVFVANLDTFHPCEEY